MYIHWKEKKDFESLIDIDGCIFKNHNLPDKNAKFILDRTYDMLVPGAYCVCVSSSVNAIEWACLLEDSGLEIKDQIAMLASKNAYTIILSMKACEKNYAQNALIYNVAGLNVDKIRIGDAIVGWNGLGKTGQTWTNKTCGFRKEQKARPVKGRFPCNLILDTSIKKQWREKIDFFHTLDITNEKSLFNFCLDMITPPKKNNLIINLFAKNNIFKKICKIRHQSCVIADIGIV